MNKKVRLRINGEDYSFEVEPRVLLVHLIRDYARLTGTHIGCVTGKCGACTVMMDGDSVKSCMIFSPQADGSEIVTIEGISRGGNLHPIQEAFWDNHALECGYCTPGQIMAAYSLLSNISNPSDSEIKKHMSGNLCRCTGYTSIINAIKDASKRMSNNGSR